MLLICGVFCLQNSTCSAEGSRLQQALCFSIYQGFVFAYESMVSSQVRIKSVMSNFIITVVMILMKITWIITHLHCVITVLNVL